MFKIPWKEYEEEELEGIIYQYYLSRGFSVDWFSKEGFKRVKNMGCNLLCTKGNETVAFSIEKQPSLKKTLFGELARKDYTEKIYLYIEKPTSKFGELIKKYDKQISISHVDYIDKMLRKTEIGLQILCCVCYANSPFSKMSYDFLSKLYTFTKNISPQEKSRMISKPLSSLWQLKDRAVTIKKSLQLLLTFLEKPQFLSGINSEALFVIFVDTLDMLSMSTESFIDIWQMMQAKNDSILRQTFLKYGNRSNWGDLWHFKDRVERDRFYAPGVLKENLDGLWPIEKKEYEKSERKLAALHKAKRLDYEPTPFFANFVREKFIRGHFNLGLALENTVDQMFEL